MSSRRAIRCLVLIGVLVAAAAAAGAESPQCAQARRLLADARRQFLAPEPDHEAIHWLLNTARNLCPSLGDAWALAHCNAVARNDEAEAKVYARQARFLGAALTCPGASGAAARQAGPLPAFVRNKFALVIGIGSFQDPEIPSLRFAAKDARDFAALLTDPRFGHFSPDHVTLLTDSDATRAGILDALQDIFVKANEEDLVLLYVSSHGSPRREAGGLGGVGYLVTYDTSRAKLWLDAIDYEGFSRQVSLIRARRKVIFLDTCYSGLAAAGAKALTVEAAGVNAETAGLFVSGEGTYVITSSQGDQRSFESETLHNSYFTHFLMRALRRTDEVPDLREVFTSLTRDVPAAVARDKHATQDPQMVPADGPGDLRIGVVPQARDTGEAH
jgi:Caspase domain